MSTESLVLGRSKRSTAGNRLRALLDKAHTIDAEEGFEEVEDDVDFEDNLQQGDVFDDDFASTDEENPTDQDPTILEKRLRKEERQQQTKERKRGYHDPLAYMKKARPSGSTGKGALKSSLKPSGEERESKKRRVELVLPQDSTSTLVDEHNELSSIDQHEETLVHDFGQNTEETHKTTVQGEARRTTMRASTRKDRAEVDTRAKEEEARRALNPLRGPRTPHPSQHLTQADLIANALEREETNRESLKDWLKKEEERRALTRSGRKEIEGPRLGWVSRVEERQAVEVDEKKTDQNTGPDQVVRAEQSTGTQPDQDTRPMEKCTRNYLVLSDIPNQADQLRVIFGDQADWTRVPFVSLRNRPLTRRKPICPLTGRPASYRHPSTLTPYATIEAYKTIEKVLRGEYAWSGGNHVFMNNLEEEEWAEGMDDVKGWGEALRRTQGEVREEVVGMVDPALVDKELIVEEVKEVKPAILKPKQRRGKQKA